MSVSSRRKRAGLKTGFSTGASASAAAGAALETLLTGAPPVSFHLDLPRDGGGLEVAVDSAAALSRSSARAVVIKDAGDDPDVTHKAAVSCEVEMDAGVPEGAVEFAAGEGVGRVTRPGLPLPVGQPAINPVPREMITAALDRVWSERRPGQPRPGVRVTVSVADGEKLAVKTLNPRLGIVGGISILGTTGLVKPFSHEAYTATIDSGLDVALAAGATEIVLTTGGKSEKLAMALRPDLGEVSFIQIADFFGHAIRASVERGVRRLGLVSFFGKAVKQAQGLDYTHAHKAPMELAPVAEWFKAAGTADDLCLEVARANTARHALDLIREAGRLDLVPQVGRRMKAAMAAKAGEVNALQPKMWAAILDHDGEILFRHPEEE